MNKKMVAIGLALAFTAATVVGAYAFTCKVTGIDGTKVTLDCKTKDAKKLVAGGQAKVKKKVEGC